MRPLAILLLLAATASPVHAGRRYNRCYTTTRYREPTVVVQQSNYDAPKGDAVEAFAEWSAKYNVKGAAADAAAAQYLQARGFAVGQGGGYAQAQGGYGANAYAQAQIPAGNTIFAEPTTVSATLTLREPLDINAADVRAKRYLDRSAELEAEFVNNWNTVLDRVAEQDGQAATIEALRRTVETQGQQLTAIAQATKPKDVTYSVTSQGNSQWSGKANTSPEIASSGARYEIAALSSGLVAFQQSCVGCHSGEEPKGDLDLSGELSPEVRWKAIAALASGKMPLADSPQAAAMDGPTKTAINQWLLSQSVPAN